MLAEQEPFRPEVAASLLPSLEVDVSAGVVASVERIADWLEEAGGLCLE